MRSKIVALVWYILLTFYSMSLGVKITVYRWTQNLHRYKLVYLEYDEDGPFVLIPDHTGCKKRVYLKLHRAQPLKGTRINDKYFTTSKTHQFIDVKDDDF